jgi:GT2 family glycosyltransferase
VDCGSGAFRRSVLNKIGGLQELYKPFYWEDVDLSYRAQKMGYAIKVEKNSKVEHEHKKGSIKKREKSNFVLQIVYRNQFYFVWLNITDRKLLINHVLYLPYHLLAAIKDRNWLFLRAFFIALSNIGYVLSERRKITSKFTVTDQTILKRFEKEVKK